MAATFQSILGIRFFNGDLEELLAACPGQFVVVPAAPALVDLPDDPAYREAVEKSDFAITDSGFMVLLWKVLTGQHLTRISGLKLLRGLLANGALKGTSCWIMPSEAEMETNLAWLNANGFPLSRDDCRVPPLYPKGPISDPELLRWIETKKPAYVIVNIGGGAQERLGYYLKTNLTYQPAILCVGAAIAFITGVQANIPPWADAFMLGWFFRCLQAPQKFIPRYWKALRLAAILAQHRDRSVQPVAAVYDRRTPKKNPVHVILLGNYLPDMQESMLRYARMLEDLLAQQGCTVEIIRPEPFFGRLRPSDHGFGKWLGYIDKFILFPPRLRSLIHERKQALSSADGTREKPLIVHICDHSNAMYTRWLHDVPHLVTCHDLLAIQSAQGLIPEHKTGATGRVLQRWILSGLRRAAFVVCVSEETRKSLLSLAPELAARSTTIPNGLPYPFSPLPPDQARRLLAGLGSDTGFKPEADRFLLHLGGNQWYKNRAGVIRIFSCLCASSPGLPLKLVMAGKPPDETLLRIVDEEKLTGKVIFTGSINDEQLCAFYSLAETLVFPSLREGFGWPIIEAHACGCPVVTSNRPPMSQIAGPAALLADPENPSDFAAKLRELLNETPDLRLRRKAEAQRHASQHDPQLFIKQVLLAYDKLRQREKIE